MANNWYDFLKKDPTQPFGLGNLSTTAKVLGGSLGAYGIASALGKAGSINDFLGIGGGNQRPVGYQGGIPEYTASRQVLTPPVGEGGISTVDRRPGSGGRRYFTDMQYTKTGDILGGRPVNTGTYMPEDQITALLAALTESQASGTGGITTPTTTTPATTTPATTTATKTTTTTPTVTNLDITNWLKANPSATDTQIAQVMNQYKVTPQQVAAATNTPIEQVTQRYNDAMLKTPAGLPTDIKNVADVANYAQIAAADKSFTAGETGSLLNMAINLNLSPTKMAEMLGVTAGDVVSHLRATMPTLSSDYLKQYGYAEGGLASLARSDNYASGGYYLGGPTDGMADKIPARIGGTQEARLSDGEFVIPADVVSHFGNGNSDAGAKVLYNMMDRVRKARTGTTQQGRQINPNKYTPV